MSDTRYPAEPGAFGPTGAGSVRRELLHSPLTTATPRQNASHHALLESASGSRYRLFRTVTGRRMSIRAAESTTPRQDRRSRVRRAFRADRGLPHIRIQCTSNSCEEEMKHD